jgi:release factor glutamine methyltransferase
MTEQTPSNEFENMSYREIITTMDNYLESTQEGKFPQEVDVNGLNFQVLENVFSPEFYDDARFFTAELKKIVKPGDKLLEIGTGIGATAVIMAKEGCEVTATDINPDAVKNAKLNAELNSVEMEVVESDIFDGINPDEQYDFIYWALPFGYVDEDKELTTLQGAIFDPGYELHRRYVSEAKDHLAPDGRLLVGFSNIMGREDVFQEIIDAGNYESIQLASGIDRDGLDFILYELVEKAE